MTCDRLSPKFTSRPCVVCGQHPAGRLHLVHLPPRPDSLVTCDAHCPLHVPEGKSPEQAERDFVAALHGLTLV